jgi:hypothetical protein
MNGKLNYGIEIKVPAAPNVRAKDDGTHGEKQNNICRASYELKSHKILLNRIVVAI